MTDLKKLSEAATQGKWGQFSADTSHSMSALIGGKPKRISEWRRADDAAFAEALVNAYRSGELVERSVARREALEGAIEACHSVDSHSLAVYGVGEIVEQLRALMEADNATQD